jgi:hypothetical protein
VLIDIDSEEELERSQWQARRSGVKPQIMVRVNPLPPGRTHDRRLRRRGPRCPRRAPRNPPAARTWDRACPPLPLRLTAGQAWRKCHVADPTPGPSRLYLDALLPADAAAHGLALIGARACTAVRASLRGTDLPDIALLAGGGAEIVSDQSGRDAAARYLYGVDLGSAG